MYMYMCMCTCFASFLFYDQIDAHKMVNKINMMKLLGGGDASLNIVGAFTITSCFF